jgi:aryl-alcohol dehydrogenase-like predicted oxidoreductase
LKYLNFSSHNISQIGLGTVRFGTVIEEQLSFEILDAFIEGDGNLIDTARGYFQEREGGYGKSEKTIGKWIKQFNKREKIFLVTKGGLKAHGRCWRFDLSRANLVKEAKESLEALNTEHIDCYLLHCDELEKSVEEIIDTAQEIKEITKAKYIGVSNWKLERIKNANTYAKKNHLAEFKVISCYWSIADYTQDIYDSDFNTYMNKPLYNYAKEQNCVVMAYASQAKGFFQKAIEKGINSLSPLIKRRFLTPRNVQKISLIKDYCDAKKTSVTSVVTSYITSQRLNTIALVGPSSVAQIDDIMCNCDYYLPKEIKERLSCHWERGILK